jgi:hypothetical protein
MKNILIIGALSEMAQATARLFAARGDRLFLMARDTQRLKLLADDLMIRGAARVETDGFDATAFSAYYDQLQRVAATLEKIDVVLIAHGSLPDQSACEHDSARMLYEFNVNGLSTMVLSTHLANILEKQGSGTLAVITSVAGDRGRQSNYVYGAAKAATAVFLQGLRNRLARHQVHVLTIKPGFVDTVMTQAVKKGPLWVEPAVIAQGIVRAIDQKKNVVYLPWFWRFIMLIIVHIPEGIFKKMRL